MRRLLCALVIAASACTESAVTPLATTVDSTPDTVVSVTSTTSFPSTSGPATTAPQPVLGLLTPTGVPVAVTSKADTGYRVLTPCGFEEIVDAGTPLGPVAVVLDPGHGGPVDTGAVGQNGLAEKELNLEIAVLAAGMLEDLGIEAVLTRTADYASPLLVRANLADSLRAEIMISIHHNAPTPGPSTEPGTEIFVQRGSESSRRLGGLLWETVRPALGVFDVPWAAAGDAGVMTVLNSRGSDAYGILRHPETPTALLEIGYLSNPPEAELFGHPLYPRVAARAVLEAVTSYLDTEDRGSGYVDGRTFDPSPGVGQDVCADPDLD